jgi:hypothetical protein
MFDFDEMHPSFVAHQRQCLFCRGNVCTSVLGPTHEHRHYAGNRCQVDHEACWSMRLRSRSNRSARWPWSCSAAWSLGVAAWAGTRCWFGRTCRFRRWLRRRSRVRVGGCSSRYRGDGGVLGGYGPSAGRWCRRAADCLVGKGLRPSRRRRVLVGDGPVGGRPSSVRASAGGSLHYGAATDGVVFPARALTGQGVIARTTVRCEAPEWAALAHRLPATVG